MIAKDVAGNLAVFRKQWEEQLHKALWAMETMHQVGTPMPEDMTRQIFQECERKKDLSLSCLFHSLLASMGLDSFGFFGDHLICLYSSCGSLLKCCGVFYKNPHPTLYSWNAILSAHVQLESFEKALDLFQKMNWLDVEPDKFTFLAVLKASRRFLDLRQARLLHGHAVERGLQTDIVIGSAIVDMYAKCFGMQDARQVFDSLVKRDVVTWNAMIGGYVQCGHYVSAFELSEKMWQMGVALNDITFSSLLKACGCQGVPEECKNLIHDQIIKQGLESIALVANSIVNMYARCGNLDVARRLFDSLICRDSVSWNAMIAGYVQNGNGWLALQLFEDMQRANAKPDKFTFSSSLQACGILGSLELGKLIHCLIVNNGVEERWRRGALEFNHCGIYPARG
eukprot:c30405_g1_i1 orf=179-1369(+)